MFRFRILFLSIFVISLMPTSQAQQGKKTVIEITNPSFDGSPKASAKYISGWVDCGKRKFPTETPPDLQPGHFLVDLEPKKDSSYLGMVARDNDTWESVSQELYKPLEEGTCYNFSLYLAASAKYRSDARTSGAAVEEAIANNEKLLTISHTDPIVLRIWGSSSQCGDTQLLAETEPIKNREWKKFDFKFEPKEELRFIRLEAFYKTPSPLPQNGHILIDDLSNIIGVPCSMEPPLVNISKPGRSAKTEEERYVVKANLQNVYSKEDVQFSLNDKVFSDFKFDVVTGNLTANIPLRNGNNKVQIKASNSEGDATGTNVIKRIKPEEEIVAVVTKPRAEEPVVTAPQREENILEGVEKKDLVKNQKLEIKNISFKADSTNIQKIYEPTLNKIADFLISNRDVVVEIGGHTNNSCDDIICNRLSENRAKSVMDYLLSSGVNMGQLKSKGYGKTEPIASNNSAYGRRRNQRVEIKILDIGS